MNTAKEDVFDITPKPQQVTREEAVSNIFELERAIQAEPESFGKESAHFSYHHWFAPKLYGREITIPADTILTTEIHASEHIAFLLKGAITVYTEKGLEYMEAPMTMITKVGTKRAMVAHGEVVFTTVHHNPADERDIDALVDMLTFKDEGAYQIHLEHQSKIEAKKP